MKRLSPLLLAAIITTMLTGVARPVFAANTCRPFGEFGQTIVLGNFYDGGLKCPSDNSSFILATPSTQAGGGLFEPFVDLRDTISPWQDWTLGVKADTQELIGDHVVNSPYEFSLAWNSPHHDGAVQFTLAALWGSYTATTIAAPIQRAELMAIATFPTWQIGPASNAQIRVTGGYATYSTSDTQSSIETDLATWGNLSNTIDWYATLAARTVSGVSPPNFDVWGGDVQVTPGLTFHLSSQWAVSVQGTWSFQSATMSSLSYAIRTTSLGSAVTFAYDAVGQTLTGMYDFPNFGNAGIQYDRLHSTFSAVFQPH